MTADWTTARVVRDSDGGLWTSGDGDWWLRCAGLHLVGNPEALPLPQTNLVALAKLRLLS